jgi:IS30 family transposase
MKYKQLTPEDRYIISHLKLQGFNQTEIACQMGRHRSTISRELARNSCWVTDGAYRPLKAQRRTRNRRSKSRRNLHYTHADFTLIRQLLRLKYSPKQVVGHIRRFNLMKRRISHETIYQYIWRDRAKGGNLWRHLRQSSKQRRKRYRTYDSRGRLAGKRHISERPDSVESRRYRGHWEIDTVMGKGSPDCIVTLVERKSGYLLIGKLDDRTTGSLNKKVIRLVKAEPTRFLSITADNGTEFHQYKIIEKATGTKIYFANPYHSWERGTNENTNGLVRQYLPKGKSMAALTQAQCSAIAVKLNTRPRQRHNFKTPEEVLYA